jgi:hypothetical protein
MSREASTTAQSSEAASSRDPSPVAVLTHTAYAGFSPELPAITTPQLDEVRRASRQHDKATPRLNKGQCACWEIEGLALVFVRGL